MQPHVPPPPHPKTELTALSFSPNVSFLPLILQKLQPHVWGDPRFKPTPWGAALLSPIYFKVWVYKEREQSFRERWWQRVDGEMARLKKKRQTRLRRVSPLVYLFGCGCLRACIYPPAAVQIPGKIDCLPRIICPRHFKTPLTQSPSYSSPLLTLLYLHSPLLSQLL